MPDAILGHGTTFSWNGNIVATLNNIGSPQMTADSIEVSTHQSPDNYKEFIQGLIDAGTVSLAGYFNSGDADGQVAMLADFNARDTRACEITLPGGIAAWTFNAFLTQWRLGDIAHDGSVPFTAELKVAGKPTLAVAASTGLTVLSISNSAVVAPAFAGDKYTYVATVLTGVSSVTVTPTAAGHTITVEANGLTQDVTSGQASSAIALGAAGSVTPIVIRAKQSGMVAKVYTIYLTRAAI